MSSSSLFGVGDEAEAAQKELEAQNRALEEEQRLIEEEEARKKDEEAKRSARTRRGGQGASDLSSTLG